MIVAIPTDYLTTAEVAARLGVEVTSVRRWINAGELPALRLGTKAGHRISEADLEKFVARRTTRSVLGRLLIDADR